MKKLSNTFVFLAIICLFIVSGCSVPINDADGSVIEDESGMAKAAVVYRGSAPDPKYFKVSLYNNKLTLKWKGAVTQQYRIKHISGRVEEVYPNHNPTHNYNFVISDDYDISTGINTVVLDWNEVYECFKPTNCGLYIFDLYHYSDGYKNRIERCQFEERSWPVKNNPGSVFITYTSSYRSHIKINWTEPYYKEVNNLLRSPRFLLIDKDYKEVYPCSMEGTTGALFTVNELRAAAGTNVVRMNIAYRDNENIYAMAEIDLSKPLPAAGDVLITDVPRDQKSVFINYDPHRTWGCLVKVTNAKYGPTVIKPYYRNKYWKSTIKNLLPSTPISQDKVAEITGYWRQNLAVTYTGTYTFPSVLSNEYIDNKPGAIDPRF